MFIFIFAVLEEEEEEEEDDDDDDDDDEAFNDPREQRREGDILVRRDAVVVALGSRSIPVVFQSERRRRLDRKEKLPLTTEDDYLHTKTLHLFSQKKIPKFLIPTTLIPLF